MANNYLRNKTIVILSPQPWEGLFISKHHYAMALALENKVYFIPAPEFGKDYSLVIPEKNKNLFILNYKLFIPEWTKFHAKALYRFFVKKRLKKLLNKLTPEIDICIDFGCYQQYEKLNWIKAEKKIFFPVDDSECLNPVNRGADLVLSVSSNICDKFSAVGINCHFINHGLASVFADSANKMVNKLLDWKQKEKICVAYAGNLFISFIDREVFIKLIIQNPEIEFNFFGNLTYSGTDQNMKEWNGLLNTSKNVKLNGLLSQEELANAYSNMDAFLLCYKPDYKNYHGENSHKIFEYLSTGRVIVSTYISIYEGTDLFVMAPKDKNQELLSIFADVISELEDINSISLQNKRIKTALNNTYAKQVERISQLIESNS